jgi:uncharacterized protein (TIGR02246 family)
MADDRNPDRDRIRTLIEQWAAAVHAGDLEGVLADHSADVVMFDVPPPHDGVRGIDAYRETWPPFFDWQASGAVFDIVSLDVAAGTDVAFGHALLRCGRPEDLARDPEVRLRLTLGLRKMDGRWVVTHEHHSFADTRATQDTAAEERAVRTVYEQWFERTAAKDLAGLMEHIAPDVVSYEHAGPLRYVGREQVREVCRQGLEASPGVVTFDVPDLTVRVADDLAVAWGLDLFRVERSDGEDGETAGDAAGGPTETWARGTRVFERRGGEWTMVHQHLSFPFAPETGQARTNLRP